MLTKWLVWCFRIVVGATFVFSGFSKAVDPWGTMYKIAEYLTTWGFDGIPREAMFCVSIGLALLEFVSGAMLMLGCMRRSVSGVLAIIMAVMLPLSAYIWIADPVSDCGCFGDALVLSNGATFAKNVVLMAMIVYLLINNEKVNYLYPPLMQWVVALICGLYCLTISLFGVAYQPIVDFRPYKVGSALIDDIDYEEAKVVYERDGQMQEFGIYELPDSTWHYVGPVETESQNAKKMFAIFDGEDDVTQDVISEEGPQMIYLVSNPKRHNRARASMANEINRRMEQMGGDMIAVVAADGAQLQRWRDSVHPSYPVYTTDDTLIKELARGDAALVYMRDGKIVWKRNYYSFASDFPDADDDFDQLYVVDSGELIKMLTLSLLVLLVVLFGFGLLDKIDKKKTKNSTKN